jgi:hypothetical protein
MRLILTGLLFLLGMFDLFLGASFLLNPLQMAPGFGLAPLGTQGMSSLRADFTAFFGVVAACMMIGAWRRNADLLLVPAALMGVAATVRVISVFADGTYPGWIAPIGVEVLHVVLLLAAWKLLPHHKIQELTS